jgi:hypothetical protein
MRKQWYAASMLVLVGASGCSSGGYFRVRSYWDTTLERMCYGNCYQWLAGANETTPSLADPDLHAFIQCRIEADLANLGYQRCPDEGSPDFFISYRSGTGIQPTSSGPTNMALLAIEAHRGDGRLLWRGWAEGAIDASTPPEVRRERIESAINRILREFHPA